MDCCRDLHVAVVLPQVLESDHSEPLLRDEGPPTPAWGFSHYDHQFVTQPGPKEGPSLSLDLDPLFLQPFMDLIAEHDFTLNSNNPTIVDADDLVRSETGTVQEFDAVVAGIRAVTDDLGIDPEDWAE